MFCQSVLVSALGSSNMDSRWLFQITIFTHNSIRGSVRKITFT